MDTFTVELAALMTARGLGVRALALLVPCNPGVISRYRRGTKRPSPEMAALLDTVLDADGALVSALAEDTERVRAAVSAPHGVDVATVDIFAGQLAGLRRLDDAIGSAAVLPATTAQLDTLTAMLRNATSPVRAAVVHQAAQWAQFTGWLHAAVGRYDRAETMMQRGITMAVESGDPNLISETTSCLGNIAWLAGDPSATVGLSKAAVRTGLHPGQVAISAAQEARGHAALGELDDAERALEISAERAADERDRADERPPWLYYHLPGFYELQRGRVYRVAARHVPAYRDKAIEVLTAGLDALPGDPQWAGEYAAELDALTT